MFAVNPTLGLGLQSGPDGRQGTSAAGHGCVEISRKEQSESLHLLRSFHSLYHRSAALTTISDDLAALGDSSGIISMKS
jgi:hypothetical protein